MSIDDHLKSLTAPLRKRTVCFLIDNERLLLGMKKRGFGKGNYLGIGGKVEQGETVIQAAIREYQEEAETFLYDENLKVSERRITSH